MLRVGRKAATFLNNGKCRQTRLNFKSFSTGNRSASGTLVQVGLGLVVTSSMVVAGGTVYAKSHPEFRNNLQDLVPQTQSYFDFVLGEKTPKTLNLKVDPLEEKFSDSRKPLPSDHKIKKALKGNLTDNGVKEKVDTNTSDDNSTNNKIEKKVDNDTSAKLNNDKPLVLQENKIQNESQKEIEPTQSQDKQLAKPTDLVVPEPTLEPYVSSTDSTEIKNLVETPSTSINAEPEVHTIVDPHVESTTPESESQINVVVSMAILKDLLSDCSIACSKSILTDNEAVQAVKFYSTVLRKALEDHSVTLIEKSKQWAEVKDAKLHRDAALQESDANYHRAIEELTKISQVVEATKMDAGDSSLNETILEVQQSCDGMSKDLEKSKAEISKCQKETDILTHYQTLISEAQDKFRAEIKAHLPELNMNSSWGEISVTKPPNTDPALVSELQKLVDNLQSKLKRKKVEFEDKVKKAAENEKHKMEKELLEKMVAESEKVLKEKFEEKLKSLAISHEDDVKLQLKRQTTAHAEHLADALAYMEKQAMRKYETALQENIAEQQKEFTSMIDEQRNAYEQQTNELRERYQTELNLAFAKVKGIIQAVDGHADVENLTRKAQELSLACDALNVTLKYGENGEPIPLNAELNNLKKVCEEDPVVTSMISAIPEEAIERGVYPEAVLKSTFNSVAQLCRRLSLVNENRNSLFIYLMSYLKSLLMFSTEIAPPNELDKKSQSDVFQLVSYAKYCVSQGDIEQAIRFTNQLTGESKKAAATWLKEARLFLETQQTVEALSAISAAILIGAQIEK